MKEYFEQLWAALPDKLEPPHFEVRRDFLLSEVHRDDRVLDLGCGEGTFTALAAQAGAEIVGAEVAEAALRRAQKTNPGLDFELVPVCGPLPFADHAFDLVWASEVIEHIADTASWLLEVRRVLRPRGRLMVSTPNHRRLAILVHGLEPYAQPLSDHLHLYTRKSLVQTLEEFAFAEVSVRTAGGPPLLRPLLLARGLR